VLRRLVEQVQGAEKGVPVYRVKNNRRDDSYYSGNLKKPEAVEMKFLSVLITVGLFAVSAFAQNSEADAVRVPLENYIKAHATGDPEYARKAFHTEGNMIWIRDGNYSSETFDSFIKRAFTGKPAADEAQRKNGRKIEAIDVTGNAAIARIVLDYPSVKFVDYMTLLKINGEWKIVNKSFYAEPKAKPTEPKRAQ
jgi:hypothetical protein